MADILTGLVAYWKFDEGSGTTASDSSGNGNNGILVNNPTWVAGKYRGAIQGNNSGFNATFNFAPTNFSVAFWINPTVLSNYNNWIGANGLSWGDFVIHTTSTGAIYCGTDLGNRIGPTSDGIYVVNQWIHMVFTYNSGVGTLYKNGVVVTSKSGMNSPAAWTQFGNSTNPNLQAILDEVRIYNRALSQADVTALYNYIPPTSAVSPTFSNITSKSAQVNSSVFSPNTANYGICYSATNPSPTLADSVIAVGSITNNFSSFSAQITGLTQFTTYYVVAYATDTTTGVTFYSSPFSFKTLQNGLLINNISISIDAGIIPPLFKMPFKLDSISVSIDAGIIPHKNYFRSQISTLEVMYDQAADAIIFYQIR